MAFIFLNKGVGFMRNTSALGLIYKGVGLLLVLALAACDPVAKTETQVSDKDDNTENLEQNTETQVLKKENRDTSSTESITEGNTKLPKYLPEDFPLPDDVEIKMSNSGQNEGKKSVLLIIRTKESMETITSMYTNYFEQRKLEDSAQTIDDKNIIIQGESLTNSEYWSMIGGKVADTDGVIELIIKWEEL